MKSKFRLDWANSSPTVLVKSFGSLDDLNGELPSITICNSFPVDRWGFLRDLLNEAKFLCNSDEECEETNQLRRNLLEESPVEGSPLLSSHFIWTLAQLTDPWLQIEKDICKKHHAYGV